jgi:hypothetical protein
MTAHYASELLVLSPVFALWAWCGAVVARRAGFSRWWGLLMLFPPAAVALIWVFAYAAWPNQFSTINPGKISG